MNRSARRSLGRSGIKDWSEREEQPLLTLGWVIASVCCIAALRKPHA